MAEYHYGEKSQTNLSQCHLDIQRVFNEAIKHRDISITCGRRGKPTQNKLFADGKTKVQYPDSYHNAEFPELADAVDAIPYPTTQADWENREYWVEWSSWIKGLATGMGITLVSGFDWDNDYELDDQSFFDGPHFQRTERT